MNQSMPVPPPRRSRLARQQNKRMAKQAITIVVTAILFIIVFLWVGIPGLIKLAVSLGNSKASSKFNIETDTIPPLPPQMELIPIATTSARLHLMGTAEPGSVVILFRDGTKINETTTDNQGNFSFSEITLSEDLTAFYTQSIDEAGNKSQNSASQTIKFDNQPPKLTIDKPNDGESFNGVSQQIIDIVGTTDEDASVYLNDRQLVVTADGSFSTKQELKEGDNKLSFIAKDKAGNQTETVIKINYSR